MIPQNTGGSEMPAIKVSNTQDDIVIHIPFGVVGPLDLLAATAFTQSLNKGGLVELIHFAAERLARTEMSAVDRVIFEKLLAEHRESDEPTL
jgi:hypothetical protein